MSQSVNLWLGIGNLGSDPEIRMTPGGAKVANFRIACSKSWKDQSGNRNEKTEWVTCVAWKGNADVAEKYLRKGMKIHVQGELQTRSWEEKNGGGKRYATEVLVERFMMLDGRPGTAAEANRAGDDDNPMGLPTIPAPVDDSDLPF